MHLRHAGAPAPLLATPTALACTPLRSLLPPVLRPDAAGELVTGQLAGDARVVAEIGYGWPEGPR